MAKVIDGTRKRKRFSVNKKMHPAGTGKIRCPGCKAGMAVMTQTVDGWLYHCDRCGRDYKAEQSLS
jgi:DNA-directed RNA polymerase subunit RPC12/RpoP